MEIFQAIILGIVQGLTEFLPISSSAHLYLIPYLFKWNYQGLSFDVALHWGTLLGVLIYFHRDYWQCFTGLFRKEKMAWYLLVGSLPAAAAGFLLRDIAEPVFRNPIISVFTLAGFGFLLWFTDKISAKNKDLTTLNWSRALFVGIGQALALVPGVSRSGATITGALALGFDRQAATRFAFLLSGPAVFGAGLVAFPDFRGISTPLVAGFTASAISGLAAIHFLLQYVARRNFNIFVWYRYALAFLILLIISLRS